MTADTSVMGAIGQAMGKASQGAVLGHAIGQLKDEADEAMALANRWSVYAKGLEQQVSQLKGTVQSLAGTAQEKIAEVADLKLERIETNEKLAETSEKLAKSQMNKEGYAARAKANEAYGKQFKFRLRQMEKGLRYSGASKEAVGAVLKVYQDVIERLNLEHELPDDLKERAETAWNQFMNGEDLTADDEVQAIIDEAPVPKAQGPATFR